jgi:hypothetical protein
MREAKKLARRPNESANTRLSWEYQCAQCKQWFPDKVGGKPAVYIDHIVPCGTLKEFGDIQGFIERCYPDDPRAFQVLCKACHAEKTKAERMQRKAENIS